MAEALERLKEAFRREDVEQARALAHEARSLPHADIERTIEELESRIDTKSAHGKDFEAIVQQLMAVVRVDQNDLKRKLLPRLRTEGKRYRKFREVFARRAVPGERIKSITSDGPETVNTAKAGDWIVRNTTRAQEQYVVSGEKFAARYEPIGDVDGEWSRYRPLGEVVAVNVDHTILELLGKSHTFYIEAPWGEAQRVCEGDELVAPPAFDEVYRIAAAEFKETYEPAPDSSGA